MSIVHIFLLAVVQGLAELLPVSSSAHVIVAEKLLGLDPSSPEMTFLLVMLHTGTMFAVLVYFWKRWKALVTGPRKTLVQFVKMLALATGVTGVLGFGLKAVIEKIVFAGTPHSEIEHLFGNLPLIAVALTAVGALILYAGIKCDSARNLKSPLNARRSFFIGAIQGICLPFRGFSRSGATISVAMLQGVSKELAEEFSFALAVVLTPPVIVRELSRLLKAAHASGAGLSHELFLPGMLGMVFSFGAGLLALKWVSSWIEGGRWKFFGVYCFLFAGVVLAVHFSG
ncbi:MAG: undecaprenyl-diphosphate phosphatase [Deltaproteobacteria bacterium]|nr:undecaprenyl-diphosphate phosphatase [Deltaproteobacteria bacterium]